MALDHVVAAEVSRARALERALHGGPHGWEIIVAGMRIPVRREISEENLSVVFHGMLGTPCSAVTAELRQHGETVSQMACSVTGPCAVRWDFRAGSPARAA